MKVDTQKSCETATRQRQRQLEDAVLALQVNVVVVHIHFFFSTAYSHKLLKTNGHTAAFSDAAAAAVRHRVPTQGDKCGRIFAFSAKSGETQKPQPVTHRCTSILLCLALEANLSISDTFVKPLEDGLACVAQ